MKAIENWLSEAELKELAGKLKKGGIDESRDILLDLMSSSVADKLEKSSKAKAAIVNDLKELNEINADVGSEPAIVSWLDNAADQASQTPEVRDYLVKLADEIDRKHRAQQNPGGFESMGTHESITRDVTTRTLKNIPDELDLDTVNEKDIFTNDLLPFGFLERAARFGQVVCRITVTRHEDGKVKKSLTGRTRRSFGTGWLLGTSYIMTNHHVIDAREDDEPNAALKDLELQAETALIEFDYDYKDAETKEFDGKAKLVLSDEDLDYAILEMPEPLARKPARLWADAVEISEDEVIPVNIIQHPGGTPKQVGMRNNLVATISDRDLAYFTDTRAGSSGSPVCNDSWQVIALHKASTRAMGEFTFQGKDTKWVNIGTRIDVIIRELKTKHSELWTKIGASLD